MDGGDFVSLLHPRERPEPTFLSNPFSVFSTLLLPGRAQRHTWCIASPCSLKDVGFLCRREICSKRNPRERPPPAPKPAAPSRRRSSRKCVVHKSQATAYSGMAPEEESDETKTEDEYIPGTSLNLVSTS